MTRCIHYTDRDRCECAATHRLMDEDGVLLHGGYCAAHAQDIVDEYREKLGWRWAAIRTGDNDG